MSWLQFGDGKHFLKKSLFSFLRICNGTGHAMSVWGGGGGGGPGTIFVISSIIENLSTPRREIRPCVEKISPPCVEKLLQESLDPASRALHPASEFSTLRREFSTLRREATIFVTNGVPYARARKTTRHLYVVPCKCCHVLIFRNS